MGSKRVAHGAHAHGAQHMEACVGLRLAGRREEEPLWMDNTRKGVEGRTWGALRETANVQAG